MDAEFIRDLFAEFGPVSVRRMFSGAGVFADGLMFALVVRDVLYLKADAQTSPRFAAEGCEQFGYTRKDGRRTDLPYWRMPDRLYDDPTELADWAREAFTVAQARRASVGDRRKSRTRTRKR
jgi:DNA transformation protein